MWRSIYLFIASSLVLVSAQTQCPFGALQIGTTPFGTPVCDECIVGEPSCNEWFNCEITQDPRCNLLNCTNYVCNSDEVIAHERFCAKAVPPGDYVTCQENDAFVASMNMCEHITTPPEGSTCVEPERAYPTSDGTIRCVSYYPPRNRDCPSDYYLHYEGSETVCFTVRPAKCMPTPTATQTAKPEEPSSTPTMTPHPEEPTQTATHTAHPEEPSSTSTVTARPEEPSSTPTHTAQPEEPSSTATHTAQPEEPSSTATHTAKPEEPSSTATHTAKPEEPSSTSTQTARPEEPSSTATQTAKPEEPTQTAKPNPCHCHEPGILVQEKHCLWPEFLNSSTTCNDRDVYIASMNMCQHTIDAAGTTAANDRPCPDGFEIQQQPDKVVCVKYYEPLSEPCPQEGFVYVKDENRLGLPAGCYKISDAMCESMSPTPKPEEPSKTSSITPKPEEPSKTSSVTPRPSARPSTTSTLTRTSRRSSTPTMTPRREEPSPSASPSGKPLPPRDICAEDPRNPRCVKPDSILNQFAIDAIISPLPTPKPAVEPVVSMRPVPTPTPWAVPEDVAAAIRPEDIPPYIPSRVSFTDGDPTHFEEPQKIQEVQASIACTLHLPLEKIRIESIKILTLSTGVSTDIQIDPTDYLMSSNGTVVCYETVSEARLLRSRRLQNTDTQIDINYLIVNPTIEILALNATEFAAVIQSSPSIQTLAQSVGSSGVASEVTVATYAGIQVPQTIQSSAASSFTFPTYGIGVLGGVGGLLVLSGFIVSVYYVKKHYKKQKSPVQSAQQPQRRVVFVDELTPANMARPPSMLGRTHSMRAQFNPLHASNAV